MKTVLLRTGERELTLPKQVAKTVKAGSRRAESPLVDFSANTTCVVYSDYEFDTVPVGFATSLDGSTKPERREMLRIKPKRGAESRLYTPEDDILDEYVQVICNEFKLPVREMERFQKRAESTGESTLGIYDIVEEHFRDKLLGISKEYGLPYTRFGEVGLIYTVGPNGRIMVRDSSGKHLGTVEEWMGDNRTGPIPQEDLAGGELARLFDVYGELVYEVVNEFLRFYEWVRDFTELKPSENTDAMADYALGRAARVLSASNAGFAWEGERLMVVHRAPSLLYGAYLRVIDRKLSGRSFRVCRRFNCGKVFLPLSRKQVYCGPTCSNTERVRRYRKKPPYAEVDKEA